MKQQLNGELKLRIQKNRERLGHEIYTYPGVFEQPSTWPGDWQGRAILALASLYETVDSEEEKRDVQNQLEEIMNHVKEKTNQHHYFGELLNDQMVDEQQISGNSWYLRGLVAYFKLTNLAWVRDWLDEITEQYLLKIAPAYANYSLKKRAFGGVGGHLVESSSDGWRYSSDIGCAFIMLDGMSAVYHVTRNPALENVMRTLIDHFLTIDVVHIEFQTHATLSCTRGILQFYQDTEEERYLQAAIRMFTLYQNFGCTYDFSNINWFSRPTTWTEPCAIVDSYIVASQLFQFTRQEQYLNFAVRVYRNALPLLQRSNGGAGCNLCVINDQPLLKVFLYEAYFCCTMRLAEGLKWIKNTVLYESEDYLFFPLLCEGTFCSDKSEVSIEGDLYRENRLTVRSMRCNKSVVLYVPLDFVNNQKDVKRHGPYLIIRPNQCVELIFDKKVHKEGNCLFQGDALLCHQEGAKDALSFQGKRYTSLPNFLYLSEEEAMKVEVKLW